MSRRSTRPGRSATAALSLAALGVVFGDIGTSPLYAFQSVFAVAGVHPDRAGVFGMISLVVWTIVLVVAVKYVALVMRADNEGEGGILALVGLVMNLGDEHRRARTVLIAIGLVGVALFFGDGTVTPAISVISSVEGLKTAVPGIESAVVPITVALLTLLFGYQQFGTHLIAKAFGPVTLGWFALIATTGTAEVLGHPGILQALSPTFGVTFFLDHPSVGFLSLGAVVLVVTGAEALFADLGQFSRGAIRLAWFTVVFPALLLNYLGQGALILAEPKQATESFFGLLPAWAQVPMVIAAVLATMIASQAVITGAFSVTRQAVQLGFLPRLTIRHQAKGTEGQVYVPTTNWLLFVAVIGLVVGFGSSTKLASAYGIAVTGTFVTTTILFFALARMRWHRALGLVVPAAILFLVLDLAFFSANLTKVASGGWFPLLIGVVLFTLLSTWRRGGEIVAARRAEAEGSLSDFIQKVEALEPPLYRTPGTAVALSVGHESTPLALHDNLEYNRVLHEQVVIVTVTHDTVAHVPADEQATVQELGYGADDLHYVTLRVGFADKPDIPAALERLSRDGRIGDAEIADAVYLVSAVTVVRGDAPGLAGWRKRLFLLLAKANTSPVGSFELPEERIVTMGSYIPL